MIVFDFVAYKVYKMVKKGKQYEGMELIPTTAAMGFSIIPLLIICGGELEKLFFNKNNIYDILDLGKIPAFLIITLPIMTVIYFYLRLNLYKVEQKISKNRILKSVDSIPNFIVYFTFIISNILITISIHKLCNS
ncbi:hypothetical protein [Chishuiella changwenlii]|uniref:hypothetical protein n=1 Tax=Chishuiella changwenlii TaxID=1434701 RepID=UPI002FDB133B